MNVLREYLGMSMLMSKTPLPPFSSSYACANDHLVVFAAVRMETSKDKQGDYCRWCCGERIYECELFHENVWFVCCHEKALCWDFAATQRNQMGKTGPETSLCAMSSNAAIAVLCASIIWVMRINSKQVLQHHT